MIKWIDIVSPTLRQVHKAWVGARAQRLMVHVADYNSFIACAPPEVSLGVILPMDGGSPVIKHAGEAVRDANPSLSAGLPFAGIASPVSRTVIATPFQDVATRRQPDCRRGAWRMPGELREYEQLLLPFDNDHLRVCVVHAVFDLGRVQRTVAA